MINLTTGPVDITPEVIEALNSPVISHRSEAFINMHSAVSGQLCHHLQVNEAFLMTGSGTMANDAMLFQIKALQVPGLILSSLDEVRRFRKCIKQIEAKKEVEEHAKITNVNSIEDLASLDKYNVLLEIG